MGIVYSYFNNPLLSSSPLIISPPAPPEYIDVKCLRINVKKQDEETAYEKARELQSEIFTITPIYDIQHTIFEPGIKKSISFSEIVDRVFYTPVSLDSEVLQ